jgi:AcrR family transcriptional regulator
VAAGGLRELKKQRTRLLIAETAQRLFTAKGFDAVTVAEVAEAAEVSEATVFNYFPTKEDLFYGGMDAFEAGLVESVRGRAPGESPVAVFRRVVLAGVPRLAKAEVGEAMATAARTIAGSRALRAREREIAGRYADELAAILAAETQRPAEDVEAAAVAAALFGAQRALVAYAHRRVLEGSRGRRLSADVRAEADRAFTRLEIGLNGYAIRPE